MSKKKKNKTIRGYIVLFPPDWRVFSEVYFKRSDAEKRVDELGDECEIEEATVYIGSIKFIT